MYPEVPGQLLCDAQSLRPVHLESRELTAQVTLLSPLASRIARFIIANYVIYLL